MKNDIRIFYCTFVKTVLMVLIVIYHGCALWTNNWGDFPRIQAPKIGFFAEWLNSFHIYSFTLVSGYIFYYKKNELHQYDDFVAFIYKKVKRLLIPFYVVGIMWVIPFEIIFSKQGVSFALRFILGISTSQLWFLFMLFDVFIVAFVLNKLIYKQDINSIAICLISWFFGKLGNKYFLNVFQIFSAFQFIPYFIIGMKLREHKKILQYLMKYRIIFMLLLGDVMLFTMLCVYKMNGAPKITLYILGAVTAFISLQKCGEIFYGWSESQIFGFLTRFSFSVFLFHQQIIYITNGLFDGVFNPYLNAGLNICISMLVALIISSLIYRFKFCRIFIGG